MCVRPRFYCELRIVPDVETRIRIGFLLAMVAGVIEFSAAAIQALRMLASLGIMDARTLNNPR